MIPKKIHYCWFGSNPKPPIAEKCIESWKKYLPDYEIIEWNETNFDINCCDYVKEAYEARKWAFVSDYARIWALNKFGGIYMDTDVEVQKNMDIFLSHSAFTGFEKNDSPFTAVLGCEPGHQFTSDILELYTNRHFLLGNNTFDMMTNTELVSNLLVKEYGVQLDNKKQQLKYDLTIYPSEYFCPKSYIDNVVYKTDNTYTIHWFTASWQDEENRNYHKNFTKLSKLIGDKKADIVLGIYYTCKKEGFINYIKKRINKK